MLKSAHFWLGCALALLLLAFLAPVLLVTFTDAAPSTVHSHRWSKWTEPKITSDWYHGTELWQSRTCTNCGLAELWRGQSYSSGSQSLERQLIIEGKTP